MSNDLPNDLNSGVPVWTSRDFEIGTDPTPSTWNPTPTPIPTEVTTVPVLSSPPPVPETLPVPVTQPVTTVPVTQPVQEVTTVPETQPVATPTETSTTTSEEVSTPVNWNLNSTDRTRPAPTTSEINELGLGGRPVWVRQSFETGENNPWATGPNTNQSAGLPSWSPNLVGTASTTPTNPTGSSLNAPYMNMFMDTTLRNQAAIPANVNDLRANTDVIDEIIEKLVELKNTGITAAINHVSTRVNEINNVPEFSSSIGYFNNSTVCRNLYALDEMIALYIEQFQNAKEFIIDYSHASAEDKNRMFSAVERLYSAGDAITTTAFVCGVLTERDINTFVTNYSIVSDEDRLQYLRDYGININEIEGWTTWTDEQKRQFLASRGLDEETMAAIEMLYGSGYGSFSGAVMSMGSIDNSIVRDASTRYIADFGSNVQNILRNNSEITIEDAVDRVSGLLNPAVITSTSLGSAVVASDIVKNLVSEIPTNTDTEETGNGEDSSSSGNGNGNGNGNGTNGNGNSSSSNGNGNSNTGNDNGNNGGNRSTGGSTDTTPQTNPQPDTTPQTNSQPQPDTTPQTSPQTQPDTTPKTQPKTQPDTTPQTNPQPQPSPSPSPAPSGGGNSGRGYYPSNNTNTEAPTVPTTETNTDTITDDVIKPGTTYKIPTTSIPTTPSTTSKSGGNGVIPVLAGLSAAAAAGVGAKAYIDRKNNSDNEEDTGEVNTEDWSDSDNVDVEYKETKKEEDTLDFDDYGYEVEEPEKYDARSHQELENLQ